MGKKNNKKNRGRGGGSASSLGTNPANAGRISYPGCIPLRPVLVAGANVLPLNPVVNLGSVLTILGDEFLEYRFTKLSLTCYSSASIYSISYNPAYDTNPSTTIAANAQEPVSLLVAPSSENTIPRTLNVSRKILLGEVPTLWFKTQATGDANNEQRFQGTIDIVGTAAEQLTIDVYYNIEFCSVDPLSTGLARRTMLCPRRSIVRDRTLPVTDMFLPDSSQPYVDGRDIEKDLLLARDNYRRLHPMTGEAECRRFKFLLSENSV